MTANFVRSVFKNRLDIQVIGIDKVSFTSLIIAFRTPAVYSLFYSTLFSFKRIECPDATNITNFITHVSKTIFGLKKKGDDQQLKISSTGSLMYKVFSRGRITMEVAIYFNPLKKKNVLYFKFFFLSLKARI